MLCVKQVWCTFDRTISDQDLYSVLSPVTWLCRIVGIFPLALKGSVGRRKYSTSYASIIYILSVLLFTLIGLLRWTEHTDERIVMQANHTIALISMYFELITDILSMIVIIVAAVLSRDKFIEAIDNLSSQDIMLQKLGTKLDYIADLKRNYIRLGIIILIFIILCTYDLIYQLEFNSRYPLNWIAWMFPNIVRIASTCLFVDIVFVLGQRFAALNEHLAKMIEKTKNSLFQTISTPNSICERIRSIALIHGALCEVAVSVNQTFGFNIITGVIYSLLILTSTIHYIIREAKGPRNSYVQILGSSNWAMISSMHIIYIITACQLTQNQASRTGKLIHKFHIHGVDTPLNTVIQSFSLQLHHERIEFSGAGLFSLDATLIQSIVGAVTTYIIIIIQFDTSPTMEIRG